MSDYILRNEGILPVMDILDASNPEASIDLEDVDQLWQAYLDSLCEIVEANVSGVDLVVHELEDLEKTKAKLALGATAVEVTLDSYDTRGRYPLGLSRWFDLETGTLQGIGSRPGYNSAVAQFAAMRRFFGATENKPLKVVLFEDDVYSGRTAVEAMRIAEENGIDVTEFIAGIQIAHESADTRIVAAEVYDPATTKELTDPRDFLAGTKQGGLVGVRQDKQGNYANPVRVPYAAPWVDVAKRASVDPDKVRQFSAGIALINMEFYDGLSEICDRTLTVRDTEKAFQEFALGELSVSVDTPMVSLAGDLHNENR
jgi:hypothetical protein